MDKDVFSSVVRLVDSFINFPLNIRWVEMVFSERFNRRVWWNRLHALEDKVQEWNKDHPVLWNVGIGTAASFVPTLSRLLFERTKDIYGPYDYIIRVKLPSAAAECSTIGYQHRRLAFEVITELAATLLETPLPEDMLQLAAEESYFGYCQLSGNLLLQCFGQQFFGSRLFGLDNSIWRDPIYRRQPWRSPILERIREALQGKRHLLLVENLHVPMSLDVLVSIMGEWRPSVLQNRRWLISTTSKDVCEKSRDQRLYPTDWEFHLTPEYYYAPPSDGLLRRDWSVLIREALRDSARSINMQLSDKGDEEFWLHVAQHCLYYGILYHHPLQEEGASAGRQATSKTSSVTSDELVRCWVAENLIFSAESPTKIPAASSQKQSNYYRSAYEAGKVVIQALQEYSLLPIYPAVSTSTSSEDPGSVSSSQDAVTGVSKLAEDVPRVKQEELNTLVESNQLGWVSFMNDHGRHVSWNWGWPRETRGDLMTTTLILRGYSDKSLIPLDKLLTPQLRVLDLSYTPINSLPHSFSSLFNLYLLSLRGCSQLKILSPPSPNPDNQKSPLAHLENLEVLDMNGVPLLEITQQDGYNKSNLRYLDVSGSNFTTLPTGLFSKMSSLEELIFGNCTNLKGLPPSMAQLSNLLILHIEGTQITSFPVDMFKALQSLNTLKLINNLLLMSFPWSLSEAKGLKELHISNCIRLTLPIIRELPSSLENLYIQTWAALEDIKILGHPNLRTFSLSGPWVRCLSVCGCRKLKSVTFSDDLTALEDVDLSGTAIEEVPHNLPNLPQLNILLLIGVPSLKRFPWHLLVRFPKVLYLVHCANDDNQTPKMCCQQKLTYGDENQHKEKTTNTAHIKINDPRMFHSFNADAANKLVREGHFLQALNVKVKPCNVTSKKPQNNEAELSTRIQKNATYRDVQYSAVKSIMPMMKLEPLQHHVEISTVNQYPHGLRHILSVANSIFITDDAFVRCLTDLSYNLKDLEECQLQRCHQMKLVFLMSSYDSEALSYLSHLQILQILDLNNLQCLVEPGDLHFSESFTLNLLKHIHLEHCPRLEKMFPRSVSLPALETLVILFCSSLKTIFYKQNPYEVAHSLLPSIKRIYLQELQQLQHFHEDAMFRFEMPNWEKLFVRGCQSFQSLPLLKKEYPKSKVKVSGERQWWNRLHLKLPEQSGYYLHVGPPEFVSPKKHIIESYLR